MSGPSPYGVTSAQAIESVAATLSAIRCSTGHQGAVPVTTLDGERVATLCPDCGEQLPADWESAAEKTQRRERDHEKDHHGHPAIYLLACRLCYEERIGA